MVLMFAAGCDLPKPAPSDSKPAPAKPPAAEQGEKMVEEKAAVGMGEKGRGYGGDVVTEPIKDLWQTKEKLVLMQIKTSLDIYKASNDGHGPKSHEEFMQHIIKENDIQLPALPAGESYVYNPAKEELMIRKPASHNSP
jgi:hypothetical protein